MFIFSSLGAAFKEGFRWHSYEHAHRLHVVEKDSTRPDRQRVKMLAFAAPSETDDLYQDGYSLS